MLRYGLCLSLDSISQHQQLEQINSVLIKLKIMNVLSHFSYKSVANVPNLKTFLFSVLPL